MNKIKFAIIGTSKITDEFLDAAKSHKNFVLSCVYSRDINKAREFADKYNAEFVFDDLDIMADSDKFDAIYIASPNILHYGQAIKFLNAKKHVLLEKAFCQSVKEADDMILCARKNNVLLTEAMRSTSAKGFLVLKDNLHKIGRIRRYTAAFCQYSSRYDAYKNNGEVHNIFRNDMGAGSLMDIGVYCIAPMINLFGMPSNILSSFNYLETGADGQGTAICSYDGFDGVIMHSKIANSHIGVEIQGEEGTMISDNIRFLNLKILYRNGTEEILFKDDIENDMYYELDDFIKNIKLRKINSDINSLENSRNVIEVLEKIKNK